MKKFITFITILLICMIILPIMPYDVTAAETSGIVSGGVYTLSCGGKNLTVSADKNGAPVSANAPDSSWAQRFVLRYDASENAYRIYTMLSENGRRRVLDIIKRSKEIVAGCEVDIYNPVDPAAQLFNIIRLPNGKFKISPKSNPDVALTFSADRATVEACGKSAVSEFQWDVKSVTDWQYMFITPGQIATTLSDPFGAPRVEGSAQHKGIDIVAERRGKIKGYTLSSVSEGTVLYEGYSKTAGNYIAIKLADGFTVRYLHMMNRSPKNTNDPVKKGDYIGNVGTTGHSTGYHLHFDCNTIDAYRGGENSKTVNYGTCVDPVPFFPEIKFTTRR